MRHIDERWLKDTVSLQDLFQDQYVILSAQVESEEQLETALQVIQSYKPYDDSENPELYRIYDRKIGSYNLILVGNDFEYEKYFQMYTIYPGTDLEEEIPLGESYLVLKEDNLDDIIKTLYYEGKEFKKGYVWSYLQPESIGRAYASNLTLYYTEINGSRYALSSTFELIEGQEGPKEFDPHIHPLF